MWKQVNTFPTPWLRGRWQVVIALSVPYNPHVPLGCRSLNYHMRLLADQYSVASQPILHLDLALIM
jgi:hypothetical protein